MREDFSRCDCDWVLKLLFQWGSSACWCRLWDPSDSSTRATLPNVSLGTQSVGHFVFGVLLSNLLETTLISVWTQFHSHRILKTRLGLAKFILQFHSIVGYAVGIAPRNELSRGCCVKQPGDDSQLQDTSASRAKTQWSRTYVMGALCHRLARR